MPTIATLVSIGLALATFFVGRSTASHTKGRETAEMQKDIYYIRDSVTEIKGSLKETGSQSSEAYKLANEALISAKSAHKRIDTVEKEIEK